MLDHLDWYGARALLEWQIELGVTEAICDAPVDRYALPEKMDFDMAAATGTAAPPAAPSTAKPDRAMAQTTAPVAPVGPDPVRVAAEMAAQATDLDGLRAAMAAFDLCELKRGARNLVFGAGDPRARVMILGDAPDRDEDMQGMPFVGEPGALLDRMLSAIGMARDHADPGCAVYLAPILPWRVPHTREADARELEMMLPFVARHVDLIAPDMVVLMGNLPCQAVLGGGGIFRLRGKWGQAFGRPVLPMLAPADLLRDPSAKRAAWADLLSLQARRREGGA
ncbi:uracil-DNA glycosylase [Roseicitreum antarcticum]|nr:uracil-DNA glycosylase [Roseicitreum antarcticum]